MTTYEANKLVTKLTHAEVDADYALDCRRVLQKERFALAAAIKGGDAETIAKAAAEARRVAEMWNVSL